jgi:small subunit ribosomal protein S17
MAKQEKKNQEKIKETETIVGTRGRVFEGFVTKKFPKRIVVEFQRTEFIRKYDRFYKKKTKLHARLPESMESSINVGDYVKIRETRPLSKIIHFILVEKLKSGETK